MSIKCKILKYGNEIDVDITVETASYSRKTKRINYVLSAVSNGEFVSLDDGAFSTDYVEGEDLIRTCYKHVKTISQFNPNVDD